MGKKNAHSKRGKKLRAERRAQIAPFAEESMKKITAKLDVIRGITSEASTSDTTSKRPKGYRFNEFISQVNEEWDATHPKKTSSVNNNSSTKNVRIKDVEFVAESTVDADSPAEEELEANEEMEVDETPREKLKSNISKTTKKKSAGKKKTKKKS